MSKSLNSVSLTGYLGADPKTHQFDNGDQVANLRLAVARQKKVDGEWVDDTVWVDVKAFGKQAESIEAYLTKGSFIAVTGQLAQPREWEGEDGAKRFTMVVDHALVTFGPRTDGSAPPAQQQRQAAPAQQQAPVSDDDIPF